MTVVYPSSFIARVSINPCLINDSVKKGESITCLRQNRRQKSNQSSIHWIDMDKKRVFLVVFLWSTTRISDNYKAITTYRNKIHAVPPAAIWLCDRDQRLHWYLYCRTEEPELYSRV